MQNQTESQTSVDVRARLKMEGGKKFVMHTDFTPAGDQPTAIAELTAGIRDGDETQVLLGVTGSGKTFTMAKVIEGNAASCDYSGTQQDPCRTALW